MTGSYRGLRWFIFFSVLHLPASVTLFLIDFSLIYLSFFCVSSSFQEITLSFFAISFIPHSHIYPIILIHPPVSSLQTSFLRSLFGRWTYFVCQICSAKPKRHYLTTQSLMFPFNNVLFLVQHGLIDSDSSLPAAFVVLQL